MPSKKNNDVPIINLSDEEAEQHENIDMPSAIPEGDDMMMSPNLGEDGDIEIPDVEVPVTNV